MTHLHRHIPHVAVTRNQETQVSEGDLRPPTPIPVTATQVEWETDRVDIRSTLTRHGEEYRNLNALRSTDDSSETHPLRRHEEHYRDLNSLRSEAPNKKRNARTQTDE